MNIPHYHCNKFILILFSSLQTEIMTSSGRRVKRRNLDECDGNTFSSNRNRKGKSVQKTSRRKSSKSKSSRPQRAAARNALHLFSKITGAPTDGEEDSLLGDFSDSESTLQESNIDSDESGRASQNDQLNCSKGKEVLLSESQDTKSHELTETHVNAVNRRRLVLKFPIRDSSQPMHEFDKQDGLVGSSSKTADLSRNRPSSQDPEYYFGNGSNETIERNHQLNLGQEADDVDLLGKIRWGVVRPRSSKLLRVRDAVPSEANANSVKCPNQLDEKENGGTGLEKENKDFSTSTLALEIQNDDDKVDNLTDNSGNCVSTSSQPFNPAENGEVLTASSNCSDKDESLVNASMIPQDTIPAFVTHSEADQLPEPNIGFPSVSTKLRSKRGSRDGESPSKHETKSSVLKNSACSTNADNNLNNEHHIVVVEDGNNNRVTSNQGENGSPEDAQVKQISTSHDSLEPRPNRDKMYKAVYRRSRSHKAVTNLADGSVLGESTSNGSNSNSNVAVGLSNGTNEALHTSGSLELETATCDANNERNNFKVQQGHGSCMVRSPQNASTSRGQLTEEERGRSSKLTVGLRSTRSRRSSYNIRETSPVNIKKPTQSASKGSWLLLSTHEEGCRYIPQQGDEVVYLRQVSCTYCI